MIVHIIFQINFKWVFVFNPLVTFKIRRVRDEGELCVFGEDDCEVDVDVLGIIDLRGEINASPSLVRLITTMYKTKEPEQAANMEAR